MLASSNYEKYRHYSKSVANINLSKTSTKVIKITTLNLSFYK